MRYFTHYVAGGLSLLLAVNYLGLPASVPASATTSPTETHLIVPDRTNKGDRLDAATIKRVINRAPSMTIREMSHDAVRMPIPPAAPVENAERKLPVGCDPSFSPVTTPALAYITGRCVA